MLSRIFETFFQKTIDFGKNLDMMHIVEVGRRSCYLRHIALRTKIDMWLNPYHWILCKLLESPRASCLTRSRASRVSYPISFCALRAPCPTRSRVHRAVMPYIVPYGLLCFTCLVLYVASCLALYEAFFLTYPIVSYLAYSMSYITIFALEVQFHGNISRSYFSFHLLYVIFFGGGNLLKLKQI